MTVADEFCIEARRAPRAPACGGRRRRRTHDPSRLRRRGDRRGCDPEQKCGHARALGSQRQLAAGDEVELSRFTPDLQHHDANGIAGERIGRRAQRVFRIGCAHAHHAARIKAKFGQPAHRQHARFAFGKILPHPDQRPARCKARREGCNKSACRRALPAAFAKHLVQRAKGEPPLQRRVRVPMSQRHPARPASVARGLDALDAATQGRKRA